MDCKKMNKSAQITLFVILGIIIVSAIILLIILLPKFEKVKTDFLNPKQYIETCISEELPRPIDNIFSGGGFLNPTNILFYNGEKYTYLCYTPNFWEKCSTLYPQLKRSVEQEIENKIKSKIEECFKNLKKDYEKKGYSVNDAALDLKVEILPNTISTTAKRKMEISKDGEIQIFDNFDSSIQSDLYELLSVVQDIVSEEAKFCKFEYIGYSLENSEYRIRLIEYFDNHIYKVRKSNSEKEFKFAVRGCVYWRGKINES